MLYSIIFESFKAKKNAFRYHTHVFQMEYKINLRNIFFYSFCLLKLKWKTLKFKENWLNIGGVTKYDCKLALVKLEELCIIFLLLKKLGNDWPF